MSLVELVDNIECDNPQEQSYLDLHKYRYVDTISYLEKSIISDATVLDVGTLPCHIPLVLRSLGAVHTIGLDHDPNRFQGQSRLEAKGMELFTCDVAREPFPIKDNSIDICLCNEVIEHFEIGAEHCLSEVARVIKADGVLLLTTPNVRNLANRIRKLLRKPIYTPEKGLTGKQLHHHEYTMSELRSLLDRSGFQILKAGYIAGSEKALLAGTFPTRLPRVIAALYACIPLLFPPLRSYLVVKAKKKPRV